MLFMWMCAISFISLRIIQYGFYTKWYGIAMKRDYKQENWQTCKRWHITDVRCQITNLWHVPHKTVQWTIDLIWLEMVFDCQHYYEYFYVCLMFVDWIFDLLKFFCGLDLRPNFEELVQITTNWISQSKRTWVRFLAKQDLQN